MPRRKTKSKELETTNDPSKLQKTLRQTPVLSTRARILIRRLISLSITSAINTTTSRKRHLRTFFRPSHSQSWSKHGLVPYSLNLITLVVNRFLISICVIPSSRSYMGLSLTLRMAEILMLQQRASRICSIF